MDSTATTTRTPQPGDAVVFTSGRFSDQKGVAIIDNDIGWLRDEGQVMATFAYSAFRGPSSAYAKDQTPHVSCSGGPCPIIDMARMKDTGRTVRVTFWRWKDVPRAGGGVNYTLDVPLWEVEGTDED